MNDLVWRTLVVREFGKAAPVCCTVLRRCRHDLRVWGAVGAPIGARDGGDGTWRGTYKVLDYTIPSTNVSTAARLPGPKAYRSTHYWPPDLPYAHTRPAQAPSVCTLHVHALASLYQPDAHGCSRHFGTDAVHAVLKQCTRCTDAVLTWY
eukprot:1715394-Rhodomonas_salina.2